MSSKEFCSEGFDLDAISKAAGTAGELIYEIGGDTSSLNPTFLTEAQQKDPPSPIDTSENFKVLGNNHFKKRNYLDAYDLYTNAIEACPGMTGKEIIRLRDKFDGIEKERLNEEYRRDADRRRDQRLEDKEKGDEEEEERKDTPKFTIPLHVYGEKLAVYHSNRAACLLHLQRYEEAVTDCDISLYLNPRYTKAMIRRMTAYEKSERINEALTDAKTAYALDPYNNDTKKHVARLEKLENERLEKLKKETMGQLKDLGNNILGNFGLSLDNFKAEQDPKTGSYNISFQQNK